MLRSAEFTELSAAELPELSAAELPELIADALSCTWECGEPRPGVTSPPGARLGCATTPLYSVCGTFRRTSRALIEGKGAS